MKDWDLCYQIIYISKNYISDLKKGSIDMFLKLLQETYFTVQGKCESKVQNFFQIRKSGVFLK